MKTAFALSFLFAMSSFAAADSYVTYDLTPKPGSLTATNNVPLFDDKGGSRTLLGGYVTMTADVEANVSFSYRWVQHETLSISFLWGFIPRAPFLSFD